MDWSDLSYVLALGRGGTMSAAGSTLGVNHTTVSRRIHALQGELGRPLFVSTPAGWQMTAMGESVFATAERMELEVMDLERALLGEEDHLTGTLRISSLNMFFGLFRDAFVEFSRRHPGITLELTSGSQAVNLTRREADVVLRATNAPPEHLVGRRVGTLRYAVYASEELCARAGLPAEGLLDDAQLQRLPWIAWDTSMGARLSEEWMREHVPNASVVARYDDPTVKTHHLAAGAGAALMSGFAMRDHANLRRLSDELEGMSIDIWLLTHPDLRRAARVQTFMEFLSGAIRAHADEMRRC